MDEEDSWNDDSEVGFSHSQATSHYHSNRFSLAADAFKDTLNALNKDSHPRLATSPSSSSGNIIVRNDIFSVLSRTALEADRTLCLFRSFVSSVESCSKQDEEKVLDMNMTISLLLQARRANEEHAAVLEGIVHSLNDDKNAIDQEVSFINKFYIISRMRIQIALALLMTGVSSLWLHLHNIGDSNTTTTASSSSMHSENENKEYAKRILCKAIRLAGSCFLNRKAYCCSPTWTESLSIINRLLTESNNDTIQIDKTEINVVFLQEKERIEETLRSVKHALLIVDLSMGSTACTGTKRKNNFAKSSSNNTVSKKRKYIAIHQNDRANSPTKQQSLDNKLPISMYEKIKDSNDIAFIHESEPSTHEIQLLLTKALWHHFELQRHYFQTETNVNQIDFHQKSRNFLTKKVLEFDRSTVSKHLSVFTNVLDILLNETQNSIEKWKKITLEIEAMKLSSSCILTLLGCIYTAKFSDPLKGLALFQKALRIQINDKDNFQVGNIISNMSSCYAMLGHPKPVMELLIHVSTLQLKKRMNSDAIIYPTNVTLYNSNRNPSNEGLRSSALWQLFYSSSLMQDWVTCSQAMEQLHKLNPSCCTTICSMFAKLQLDRPGEASKICPIPENFRDFSPNCCVGREYFLIAFNIFYADAMIYPWLTSAVGRSSGDIDISQIVELTSSAISFIEKCSYTEKPGHISQLLSYLKACALNNHAYSLVMSGNNFEALSLFSKATNLMKSTSKFTMDEYGLCPLYNIVILLLKERYWKEAVSIWKKVRKLSKETKSSDLEKNNRSNNMEIQYELLDENLLHNTI